MNPPRYASIEELFAKCPAHLNDMAGKAYDLGSFEAVPDCRKYSFPPLERIEFRRAFGFTNPRQYVEVRLSLPKLAQRVTNLFVLTPKRFDAVKRELSAGWMYMPWVDVERGRALLVDGRHRIVALMKLGALTCLATAPVFNVAPILEAFGAEADSPDSVNLSIDSLL
jgi:hypothetical protein